MRPRSATTTAPPPPLSTGEPVSTTGMTAAMGDMLACPLPLPSPPIESTSSKTHAFFGPSATLDRQLAPPKPPRPLSRGTNKESVGRRTDTFFAQDYALSPPSAAASTSSSTTSSARARLGLGFRRRDRSNDDGHSTHLAHQEWSELGGGGGAAGAFRSATMPTRRFVHLDTASPRPEPVKTRPDPVDPIPKSYKKTSPDPLKTPLGSPLTSPKTATSTAIHLDESSLPTPNAPSIYTFQSHHQHHSTIASPPESPISPSLPNRSGSSTTTTRAAPLYREKTSSTFGPTLPRRHRNPASPASGVIESQEASIEASSGDVLVEQRDSPSESSHAPSRYWKLGSVLGQGAFSLVWSAHQVEESQSSDSSSSSSLVAIKMMDRRICRENDRTRISFVREVSVLKVSSNLRISMCCYLTRAI